MMIGLIHIDVRPTCILHPGTAVTDLVRQSSGFDLAGRSDAADGWWLFGAPGRWLMRGAPGGKRPLLPAGRPCGRRAPLQWLPPGPRATAIQDLTFRNDCTQSYVDVLYNMVKRSAELDICRCLPLRILRCRRGPISLLRFNEPLQ